MVNTTHLRTLCEVVREGSFAAAGRRLGYTAAAISQQIAALEHAVGITLFEREARGVRTTTAARFIASRGEELLMRVDGFEAELVALAGGSHGRLRIGSFPTANARIVPQVLADLIIVYPDAEVELDEGNTGRLLAGVVEGELDVAVVHIYAMVPERWPRGLTVVDLMTEDLLLVLPLDHPSAGRVGPRRRLDALRDERWISSQSGTAAETSLRRICAAHGFVPTVAFRTDDYDVVQGLVRGGAGVAIVPEMGYTPDGTVHGIPLGEFSPGRRILALHRTANPNPLLEPGLAALQKACRDGSAAHPATPSSEAKKSLKDR